MIDYYETVDFDQEVWTLHYGKMEQDTLRDVCREHGDDDREYRAEGCELFEYRPNHQLPRSVVATFDSEAEAEHAYWLLLLHNVNTTDNAPWILWDSGQFTDVVDECPELLGNYAVAKELQAIKGGWLMIVDEGYWVCNDPGIVKDLRGQEFLDECERQQCWDETLLKEDWD